MTAGLPKFRGSLVIAAFVLLTLAILVTAGTLEQKKTSALAHMTYAKMTQTQDRQRQMIQTRTMVETKALHGEQKMSQERNQGRQQQSKGHGNGG